MANDTASQLRDYSWMAQASYLDLSRTTPFNKDKLIFDLKNDTFYEASRFAADQASIFTDPSSGYSLVSQQPDDSSGLSATVFQSAKDGGYTIAVRGTDPVNQKWEDLIKADALGVVAQGMATDQLYDAYRYYKQLTSVDKVAYTDPELATMASLLINSIDNKIALATFALGGPVLAIIASWTTDMTRASRVQSLAAGLKQEFAADNALNLIPANAPVNFTGHSLGGRNQRGQAQINSNLNS